MDYDDIVYVGEGTTGICSEGNDDGVDAEQSKEEVEIVRENGPVEPEESVSIPVIGVTPPEAGTEYDEDEYYARLESRSPVQQVAGTEQQVVEPPVEVVEQQVEDVEQVVEVEQQVEDIEHVVEDVEQPVEVEQQVEDLDSWIKVDDVDFDRSEETEIEVVVPDHLDRSESEDLATDRSQASDVVPSEHACADRPALCVNKPDSDSESSEAVTSSSSAEKKSKKKKSGDGGETKTKRNKKNKEGKENISVNAVSPTNLAVSPVTPNEILLEDAQDLSNVSVKELTQTYCSEATKGFDRNGSSEQKETYATGVSIKELRRSFGDLTNLVDKDELQSPNDMSGCGEGSPRPETPPVFSPTAVSAPWSTSAQAGGERAPTSPVLSPITVSTISPKVLTSNVGWKARSLSDLRMSAVEAMTNPRSKPASMDEERPPIHTGVSVKALAASYCNLINVRPATPSPSPEHRTKHVFTKRTEAPPADNTQKSSFSKFDALQKKTVLHVRSVDASKVQKQFNQANLPLYALLDEAEAEPSAPTEVSSNCKVCAKQVFQMEQVKAERAVYHKNCFRCLQCSKQLTVDTYSSHEGQVYCKPHFKELFQPKVVIEDDAEPGVGLLVS